MPNISWGIFQPLATLASKAGDSLVKPFDVERLESALALPTAGASPRMIELQAKFVF